MNDRPYRRWKAKAAYALQVLRAKRLNLAANEIRLPKKHVFEIERRKKMLLISGGAGDVKSKNLACDFALKQVAVQKDLGKSTINTTTEPAANPKVLGNADDMIEN